MTSPSASRLLSPSGRVNVLAFILAVLGVEAVVSFLSSSRFSVAILALPIALGLLTHRELWRKSALAYVVLHAAVVFGVVSFILRVITSQSAATATGPFAPSHLTTLAVAEAFFLLSFGFTVLRHAEVKVLFQPLSNSPGA